MDKQTDKLTNWLIEMRGHIALFPNAFWLDVMLTMNTDVFAAETPIQLNGGSGTTLRKRLHHSQKELNKDGENHLPSQCFYKRSFKTAENSLDREKRQLGGVAAILESVQ